MGRYFKDCLADPGAGARKGKRRELLKPGMNFELGLQELKYASTSTVTGFLKDPLPLGAVGYSVILQQLF